MPLPSVKSVAIATARETKRLSGTEIASLVRDLVSYAASMDRKPTQALTSQIVHIHSLFWSAFSDRSTVFHTFPNCTDCLFSFWSKICQLFPVLFGENIIPLCLAEGLASNGFLCHKRLIVFSMMPNIQILKCALYTIFNSADYSTLASKEYRRESLSLADRLVLHPISLTPQDLLKAKFAAQARLQ